MDQALKARLIGAVILVGLAVLVIPELLSGRKSDQQAPAAATTESPASPETSPASRTITIELGSQQGDPHASSTEAAPAPTPVPKSGEFAGSPWRQTNTAPATTGPDTAVGSPAKPAVPPAAARSTTGGTVAAGAPTVTSSEASASAKPVATSSPREATASGRTWSVQVGAFGTSAAAQKLAAQLDDAGFAAYVAPTRQSTKALHRVRVGPVPDRSEADRLAARLKSRGLPVTVVAND
jgi:DedD protein